MRALKWVTVRRLVQLAVIALLIGGVAIGFINGNLCSFSGFSFNISCPLGVLQVMAAARLILVPLLMGAIVLAVMAILLGRVFCGWICPVNTLLEYIDRALYSKVARRIKKKHKLSLGQRVFSRQYMYYALGGSLLLSLLTRVPAFCLVCPVGGLCRSVLFGLGPEFLFIPILVVLEAVVSRRIWCRYLCPLGALHSLLARVGLAARLSPFQVRIVKAAECRECYICQRDCPMGIEIEGYLKEQKEAITANNCTKCGVCVDICPTGALSLGFGKGGGYGPRKEARPVDRRLRERGLPDRPGLPLVRGGHHP